MLVLYDDEMRKVIRGYLLLGSANVKCIPEVRGNRLDFKNKQLSWCNDRWTKPDILCLILNWAGGYLNHISAKAVQTIDQIMSKGYYQGVQWGGGGGGGCGRRDITKLYITKSLSRREKQWSRLMDCVGYKRQS